MAPLENAEIFILYLKLFASWQVMAVLMRELSATMAATASRKASAQTSASIAVLLTVNAATNTWLRRSSLISSESMGPEKSSRFSVASREGSTLSASTAAAEAEGKVQTPKKADEVSGSARNLLPPPPAHE